MTDFAAPIHRRLTPRAPSPPSAPARSREDWRLSLVVLAFFLCYGAVAVNMGLMALSEPAEPRLGRITGAEPVRGEIIDRNGELLAANLPAWSLYAHPQEVLDPVGTANGLAAVFPDMGRDEILSLLTSRRSFVWIRRPITPNEKAAVQDLGQPGLFFGTRDMRIYPAGATAAHIVGKVSPGREAVHYAELVGSAGVERHFDERLRDPARAGEPLALSIDLRVQQALREVLAAEKERLTAIGAAGILMDVHSGEVIAMVSLPDFDPNDRTDDSGRTGGRSPRFNRAVQGVYELGSVFKPLTAAMALDAGHATPETLIPTRDPIFFGRQRVRDMHRMPELMSVTDIVRRSSNVGTARLALRVTTPVFQDYLRRLGMFDPSPFELSEARASAPLLPPKWTELSTMNISFGHGLAVSPMHLAAAYATIANGGLKVGPTLLKGGNPPGERVFSPEVSRQMVQMMRLTVTDGTGRRADVEGYGIGGKTGTADKPRTDGRGYDREKVIATFGAVFPSSDPKYVLMISMDEPTARNEEGEFVSRQAGRTAAPAVSLAVRRIAPILGMRPVLPPVGPAALAAAPTGG